METATRSPIGGRAAELVGRRRERELLDGLIEAVGEGASRVLVVRGEPGVGKTALLEYLAEQASSLRVARAAGVQSEMELAFAGLHQLLTSMLDRLDRLPVPQRDALRTAFGLSTGPVPDLFFVALAVLGLLSDVAEEQPVICLVDDEQWLDRASAQILVFVGAAVGGRVGRVGVRGAGRRVATWRGCRSSLWRAWVMTMRAPCSTRRSPGRWTLGCATRSSVRRAVIRWR